MAETASVAESTGDTPSDDAADPDGGADPRDVAAAHAGPAHAARGTGAPRRRAAAWVGSAAVVAAAAVGIPMALRTTGASMHSAPASLQHITVDPTRVPLSIPELQALLDHPADLGPLSDGRRRAACLSGLGYPSGTPVLGGSPIRVAGRNAILLVLAGDQPESFDAVAVAPTCSAADTGRLAATVFPRRP